MKKRFLATLMVICIGLTMSVPTFAANADVDTTSNLLNDTNTDEDWTTIEPLSSPEDIIPQTVSGTEIWNPGMDVSNWFTFTGNNLTPVKTMGATGKMYLLVYYKNDTPVKLQIQIRKAGTKENIVQWTTGANTYYENDMPAINVTKGQKIQISFKVLDKNGNYSSSRKLKMSYGYILSTN